MWSFGNIRLLSSICLLGAFLLMSVCGCADQDSSGPVSGPSPAISAAPPVTPVHEPVPTDRFALLATFNRGAALMEQYRYSDAARMFVQWVSGNWDTGRPTRHYPASGIRAQRTGFGPGHSLQSETVPRAWVANSPRPVVVQARFK